MNSQAQLSAAQQLASSGGGGVASLDDSGIGGDVDDDDDIPDLEAPDGDEPVDETGVESKDIDLVMAQVCLWCLVCCLSASSHIVQVGCSRAKAVAVLKESGGDLINASTCVLPVIQTSESQSLSSHGSKRMIFLLMYLQNVDINT